MSCWSAGPSRSSHSDGPGRAPKNRTVSSLRETPLKSPAGGWYLTTSDPAIIGSEPDKREVLDWDVRLAVRLMKTGGLMPEIGDLRVGQ